MPRLFNIVSALIGALSGVQGSSDAFDLGTFENLNVLQSVDLTQSYVKQSIELEIINTGSEPQSFYTVPIPEDWASSLAGLEARDSRSNYLPAQPLDPNAVAGYRLYKLGFEQALQPNEKMNLSYVLAFVDGVTPLPASAKQSDSQWLFYNATRNTHSLYRTHLQKTQLKLLTEAYEELNASQEAKKPSFNAGGLLTYGPYEDVQPLDVMPLELRFENPLAILRVEHSDRTIWVSHWGGTVSFDESYDFHNAGTRVEQFSRVDFGKPHVSFNLNNAAIRYLGLKLPGGHREEYYVDQVGNVSTSRVSPAVLEILPRYPVMGGWFYNFTVGWASDLSNFVHSPVPNTFILAVPLLGGPDHTSYRSQSTKIVLPEGAANVDVYSEVPYKQFNETVTYSYLDIYGRPTVELEYENLVSDYASASVYVTYNYTTVSALRKPASYAATLFVLFATLHYLRKLF